MPSPCRYRAILRTRAGRPHAVSGRPMLIRTYHAVPMSRCAVALRGRFQNGILVAWQGNGMACLNLKQPHGVIQMGERQSKALAERHGRGTAWYVWISLTAPYTLSVQLSDFTVWHHTWRKNWVNSAVLTGNSAGLETVLSSCLSHRELRSSPRESHSFLTLPANTTMASSQGTQPSKTKKKRGVEIVTWRLAELTKETDKPDGKRVPYREHGFSKFYRKRSNRRVTQSLTYVYYTDLSAGAANWQIRLPAVRDCLVTNNANNKTTQRAPSISNVLMWRCASRPTKLNGAQTQNFLQPPILLLQSP
jgi:hypothetical protein